jgi:hypothetical protein
MSSICYFKALIIYFARHYDYILLVIYHMQVKKKNNAYIYIHNNQCIYICMHAKCAYLYTCIYNKKTHLQFNN